MKANWENAPRIFNIASMTWLTMIVIGMSVYHLYTDGCTDNYIPHCGWGCSQEGSMLIVVGGVAVCLCKAKGKQR